MGNDFYPVVTNQGSTLVLDSNGTVVGGSGGGGAHFSSLEVTGDILGDARIRASNEMYASAFSPVYGGATVINEAGGQGLTFWWDGYGFHATVSGSDVCSWAHGLGKTFVIPHPVDPDRYLIHACLEGPEAAVFYRGEATLDISGKGTVTLPDYFDALTVPGSATVQVTQILDSEDSPLAAVGATRVKDGQFTVRGFPQSAVSWRVEATRRDCTIEVEPLRKDTKIRGSGPYTWVASA